MFSNIIKDLQARGGVDPSMPPQGLIDPYMGMPTINNGTNLTFAEHIKKYGVNGKGGDLPFGGLTALGASLGKTGGSQSGGRTRPQPAMTPMPSFGEFTRQFGNEEYYGPQPAMTPIGGLGINDSQLGVTQDGPFRNAKDLAMYESQNNLPPSQQDGQWSQRNADYTRYNASPMQQPSFAPPRGTMGGGMFTGNTGNTGSTGGEPYTPQSQQGQPMALTTQAPQSQGANMPLGQPQAGTFKPVTFRSGTGTSTSNAGGMTTELNEPYSGLAGLVGSGSGLLGQAAQQSQQAPNQFSYDFNPQQAGQDLFNQRAALLEPSFAQQNTKAQEAMFGSGRLGLRLAGEGQGVEGGMVSPDALGVSQSQSQALAGLAAQSTNDAFAQEQAMAGLQANQFGVNQQAQQQRFANLMGSGQGMLQAGMQGTQLEQAMAQQQLQNQQLNQDYNLAQQNYNLAAQGQAFGQGLSNEQLALAQQGQAQDYGLNEAQFNLASQGQFQNYGLAQQQQLQDYGLAQQNYGLAQQQQLQDYGFGMQNYGLAQQQQAQDYGFGMQDYGLNQQKMALAQQQQAQDYGFGQQDYGLQRDTLAQNYEMGTEQNAIARMTGQAQANKNNYQPNPWLTTGVGLGTAYLGSEAGSGWLSDALKNFKWP